MTKLQFWILNCASLLVAALLLGHFFFSRSNSQIGDALARDQEAIVNAKKLEKVLDQVAKRIAIGSETDPQLAAILQRYGMKVTLDRDGKEKNYP
jgi:hypothetical protein